MGHDTDRDTDRDPGDPGGAPARHRPFERIRPAAALADRIVLECARRARHGVPFGLLAFHHPLWRDDGPASRDALSRRILEDVARVVRVSDAVYRAGLPGCHVLVLPHTAPSFVDVPLKRIEERVRGTAHPEVGPLGGESISVEGDADAILARLDAHFRERVLDLVDDAPGATGRPPARLPVGDASRLEEALHTEINLAGRDGTSLSVVTIRARRTRDTVPGLLACDVDEVASRSVRGCDQVFELGPAGVALVLARTRPDEAEAIAARVVEELFESDPESPHGPLTTRVLEFDQTHRDAAAFLAALDGAAD